MIIDKVIGACNICGNSWFMKKDNKGKMKAPKKCPACMSPNWNRTDLRKYKKKDKQIKLSPFSEKIKKDMEMSVEEYKESAKK